MNVNGMSTGYVSISKSRREAPEATPGKDRVPIVTNTITVNTMEDVLEGSPETLSCGAPSLKGEVRFYRRHAADETALLLAKAVKNNVRCIAFCKTRSLVEWVYERTISALRSDATTEHLACRVESYRGGYSVEERRLIEQRLFRNELLAVVGTSALELGVDIGGIDITLHCGYPSSHSSLLQQAGRAGRGSARLGVPSLAIMICFNSPSEQHLWRNPKNLLNRGLSIPTSVPLSVGLLELHLLCAGKEYPLTGRDPVTALLSVSSLTSDGNSLLNDYDLLGAEAQYSEAHDVLLSSGSLVEEIVPVSQNGSSGTIKVYKTHPVCAQ
jgi:DEAD/DEAH box helicase domain-containing protein